MTEKTLGQVLSDGSLVDNTEHRVREMIFRPMPHGAATQMRPEKGKNRQNSWSLIRKAAEVRRETSELVFLTHNPDYEHNTDDPFIDVRGNDDLEFTLKAGNLIGSVRAHDCTLTVSSRFGEDFLRYIIADADGFLEVPNQGGLKKEGYEWLLIYLWLVKLKKLSTLSCPRIIRHAQKSCLGPAAALIRWTIF